MSETKTQVSKILGFLAGLKQDMDEINARGENSKTDENHSSTPVPKIRLIRKGSKWDIADRKREMPLQN